MSDHWTDDASVKVCKPSKQLQKKAGTGTVSPEVIRKAEAVIENNTVDFVPMAREYLKDIDDVLCKAEKHKGDLNVLRQSIVFPVMQMKSNGRIFGYPLVSELSGIVLSFLEMVRSMDQDVLDILRGGHQVLSTIISQELRGDDNEAGEAFKLELYAVCDRYMKKQSKR